MQVVPSRFYGSADNIFLSSLLLQGRLIAISVLGPIDIGLGCIIGAGFYRSKNLIFRTVGGNAVLQSKSCNLFKINEFSLFHMRIIASVTKSSHQDRGPWYLRLPIFFSYTCTLLSCWKIKSCCNRCFPQQIRPQITVKLYILRDYSSVRIGFNMIRKCHTLPVVYTMLV